MLYFLFTLLGFVLGSTLFAYWIPKLLKNIDICTLPDDHNPGVSNAFMYGGFLCGILSLICELAKGFIPVYLDQKDGQKTFWGFTRRRHSSHRVFCSFWQYARRSMTSGEV